MSAFVISAGLPVMANSLGARRELIDDFRSADGRSVWGTSWQGITDRVMGGISEMQAGYREAEGEPVLFMQGQVRLENNGGFIQLRLPLAERGSHDASAMSGLRLCVRGRPGAYFVHLRSKDSRQPWAYYRAPLEVAETWQAIDLVWADFEPVSLRPPLDTTALRSLALVAYGERFEAELEVRRIEFLA